MPSPKPEGLPTHRSPYPGSHRRWASPPATENTCPARLPVQVLHETPSDRGGEASRAAPRVPVWQKLASLLLHWVRPEDGGEPPGTALGWEPDPSGSCR